MSGNSNLIGAEKPIMIRRRYDTGQIEVKRDGATPVVYGVKEACGVTINYPMTIDDVLSRFCGNCIYNGKGCPANTAMRRAALID